MYEERATGLSTAFVLSRDSVIRAETAQQGGWVQPIDCNKGSAPKNGAKRLLNGNGGALNTLFWWDEKAILCVLFEELSEPDEIGINMFNNAKYARC